MAVEKISDEEAYQIIKAAIGEKEIPEDGPAFILSPEASKRLYEKLRDHDRFKAESMTRGGSKVIL